VRATGFPPRVRVRGAPGRVGLRVGLRPRLTAVCTGVVALVSALLLWLGWLLVGGVAQAPSLPPGSLVRVGGRTVPSEQVSAAVGAAAREEVLRAGLVAFPLLVVAAALVSWWLVGRVLGPLHAVTATARRLSVESLDTRTGVRDARGEVAELAAGFDAMLDRLQAAFEAQRRFVANASHELRTPLSVLRTEVDVTLSDPAADVEELRRMGAVVRDATRRADDLVAGLLMLARVESGAELGERAPLDLADLVVSALAAVRADATARGLRVLLRTAPAPMRGDPVLVERVVGNLLENAVRHNIAGGWLEVCTCPIGASEAGVGGGVEGGAELRVASSGPEVAPEGVDELFEPFRRGPVERTGAARGAGLGLSIVRAVVLAHGGTVEARSVVGGGLSVTVRLPA
jgi:signal transduction histidine kinase